MSDPAAAAAGVVTIEDERDDGSLSAPVAVGSSHTPTVDPAAADSDPVSVSVSVSQPSQTADSTHTDNTPTQPAYSGPDPNTVFLPMRIHSIHTTYIAKSNHFLQCDPLVVVAIDNKPMFKSAIQPNTTTCKWDMADAAAIHAVPGGITLTGSMPIINIPVSDLSSKLRVHQEDFSKLKTEDDMGGFSVTIEEIVTRSWKKSVEKKPTPVATTSATPATVAASSAAPVAAVVDGWYPVTIDNASLLDRVTGRHLGEISLKLSLQLEPYLQYLVAAQTGLHLLYELTQQFLANPTTETPLKHILLHPPSLRCFISFVVKASADRGSMDGERLRERLYPLLHKCLDIFKPESQILDVFFSNESDLWRELFCLRKSVPVSSLASAAAFQTFEGLIDLHIGMLERVGLWLEPPPPPPVKSEEEIALEAAAEAAAAKRAAAKEKKRRAAAIAAGEDPDEPPKRSTSAKKKSLLTGSALPDPPVYPPSSLNFGLATLDLLHELFDVIHIRLSGFKKTAELDWTSEQKMADLVHCCELLYKVQAFLFRYGSWSVTPTPDGGPKRVGTDEVRSFFLKETGDLNALWLQKQLVSAVKKTRDTLPEQNKELFVKLQQHAEWWIKQYPAEKKVPEKKSSNKKK